MEQGRIILAVGLSFLVFLVYDFFFVEKQMPPPPAPADTAAPTSDVPKSEALDRPEPAAPPQPLPPTQMPAGSARTIVVETPLYKAEMTEAGGAFSSFKLKNYKESTDIDSPLKEILDVGAQFGEFRLIGENPLLADMEQSVFIANIEEDKLVVEEGEGTIAFDWTSKAGIRFIKTFRFSADSYQIGLDVSIYNSSAIPVKDAYSVGLYQPYSGESSRYGFVGPNAFVDGRLEEIDPKKIDKNGPVSGLVTWIGQVDRYFMRALIPKTPVPGMVTLRLIEEKAIESRLVAHRDELAGGSERTDHYLAFMGPKSNTILDSVGHELKRAVNFGMFDFLAKPLLWLMNHIYMIIPNYGVAIILLTILTKILLWPLGTKSYKSMAEMRKLQPLMADIREKHKNDKKKMNEEMMGLYRTYKINPMGGCLPMVVQIPFFFALYRMLYEAIELRHAPFIGWINDLSAPDRLFNFGFSIPFMEPPYGIPVLTIVMGATMFLQQKMSPAPGDPTQAKLMMFMPLIFTFIFINFSAGLVLYWLVNNILSIGQQYYIQKKYV
ncbi:MAG: membrane protein insertase YidC [Desulfobacterales bacterium]|jgi:YidC/Oxa1 family membrane protein insertase